MNQFCRFLLAASFSAAALHPASLAAARKPTAPLPDFTKGDPIPEGFTHDWTLGATGARGWIYSDKLVTSDARQIRITGVAKGSPADGLLTVGDIILGAGGKPFSYDSRVEFGKALTVAESAEGKGGLRLTRWRDGKTEEVIVKLPVMGDYSATAPYDCPKSRLILEQGCMALAKRMKQSGYAKTQNPVTRSLNALALLASGNKEYLPLVKNEAEWASGYSVDAMATWYYGYVVMLLSEYVMATGDESVMPGLRSIALEAAHGQSIVGSWGHRFAGPDGRLIGYGMMNAPGLPLTSSLVLAQAAGVKDPEVAKSIERSAKLLRFYIGKGAIPYGDHHPWIETHDDNGKCGMAAVLFSLMNEPAGAEFFSRMSLASHGPERDCGHTGNFWNVTWAMPGVARSGPQATGAWMKEFGAWYFDLARGWDGNFRHQGPPQPRPDATGGWDATGAYLIAYAMPLKKIHLTGKRPSVVPQLDAGAAKQIVSDGRGWSSKDKFGAYDGLAADILIERLGSWSPVVRERAAVAIARRKEVPVPALIALLDAPGLESRVGACQALAQLEAQAAPAIPALRKALHAEDLWLRIKAADALSSIGQAAASAIPELLEMLAHGPDAKDPRGMQQRYLIFALFSSRGGMLGPALKDVDRDLLFKAVRAGLQNEDGRARGSIASVYQMLSYDEIKPLLPAILDAVRNPAPSGIMFADQIRKEGLKVLASHHVEEGMPACVEYIKTQNRWGSEKRAAELMAILIQYGANARAYIPELEKIATNFEEKGEGDFPRHAITKKVEAIREGIRAIKASEDRPKLVRITR